MGNKQSNHKYNLTGQYEHEMLYDSKQFRPKRKANNDLNNLKSQMNRSVSSPNVNNNSNIKAIPQLVQPPKLIASRAVDQQFERKNSERFLRNSSRIDLANKPKSKQTDLNGAVKNYESKPAASPSRQNSKLYKPNSLILSQSVNNLNTSNNKNLPYNTLPNKNTNFEPENANKQFNNSHYNNNNNNNNYNNNNNSNNNNNNANIKEGFKLTKKLGLSPKLKRKIVETVTNRLSSNNRKSGMFSQSRLFQALQSQWNLFTSSSNLNDLNGNGNDDENDDENYFKNRRMLNNHLSRSTFLCTSLERNSFRYASRRKYKTQSLANPFRHANTNYPVYTHEALFMPEFSVKGQVTEADFEILDVISRGAFGHVIKVKMKKKLPGCEDAADENNDQIYAMKIMWKSQVIRDRALQQVKDEVTIAISCVDNPLIVKTWFFWQSKRFLYIITDFIENGELLSLWLKVHHFPERLVALYAIEMALILDYLHKRGIIYRDIKMENILLDKRGHVQLIDFGLSKWLKMGERTCTICGTIQYMAPEILSVEPYDHSVDWWSLGILAYALLSGEYPLNAAKDHIQMNDRVSRHVFELDRSKGAFSEESCDLVRKLLRKNPHRRLKSLNDIKKEQFFLKEMQTFINKDLVDKKQNLSEKERQNLELIVNDNFWNPYFIIENYSPLELLFEELQQSKVNNNANTYHQVKPRTKILNREKAEPKTAANTTPPPPVPPAPQIQIINSKSRNEEACSVDSSSNAGTRTSLSVRNTTSEEEMDEENDERSSEDNLVNDIHYHMKREIVNGSSSCNSSDTSDRDACNSQTSNSSSSQLNAESSSNSSNSSSSSSSNGTSSSSSSDEHYNSNESSRGVELEKCVIDPNKQKKMIEILDYERETSYKAFRNSYFTSKQNENLMRPNIKNHSSYKNKFSNETDL